MATIYFYISTTQRMFIIWSLVWSAQLNRNCCECVCLFFVPVRFTFNIPVTIPFVIVQSSKNYWMDWVHLDCDYCYFKGIFVRFIYNPICTSLQFRLRLLISCSFHPLCDNRNDLFFYLNMCVFVFVCCRNYVEVLRQCVIFRLIVSDKDAQAFV